MTKQLPSVGRIVHYRLTEQDVNDAFIQYGRSVQAAVEGDVLPAIVVACYAEYRSIDAPTVLDLSVFVPGGGILYVQGVAQRDEALPDDEISNGCWSWPPRMDASEPSSQSPSGGIGCYPPVGG